MRATTEKIFISNLMLRLPLISFLVVRKKNRHQHNILSTAKNGIVTRDCAVFFNNLTKIKFPAKTVPEGWCPDRQWC